MKIKTFIYLTLIIGLFGSLNFMVIKQKDSKHKSDQNKLIEFLETVDHDYKFEFEFSVFDDSNNKEKGTSYRLFDKTEENTFKLKSKPKSAVPRSEHLPLNPTDDPKIIYDNINLVSIEVIKDLLQNFEDYSVKYPVNDELKAPYNDIFTNKNRRSFTSYIFGIDIGLDYLLRSVVFLFLCFFTIELLNKYSLKFTKIDLRIIYGAGGLMLAFRILALLEIGNMTNTNIYSSFTISIFEYLLLLIPMLTYKTIIDKWDSKFEFLETESIKAVLLFCIGVVFLFIIHTAMVKFLKPNVVPELFYEHRYTYNSFSVLKFGVLPLVSLAFANALNNTYKHLISEWRTNKVNSIDQERMIKTEAKLSDIQSSVNPHFLYNSFNSIASLAKKDPNKTEQMTLALSRFYKYTTNREQASYSTVEEEIEMINTYLEIEKIRFGDKLSFEIDLEEKIAKEKIPYFSLQPLVENAIKYGYNEENNGIEIKLEIYSLDNDIIIKFFDSGKAFADELDKGYGLQSISKKLKLLYPALHELSFHNNPKHVSVILKNQI